MANTREHVKDGTAGTYARANTDEWYYDSASGLFKNASSNQIRPAPEMTMKYHAGTTSDSTKHTPVSRTIREGVFFEDGQTILIGGTASINNYQKTNLHISTAVWSDLTASPILESTGYCKSVVNGAAGDNNPYWEPKYYHDYDDFAVGDIVTAQYFWKPVTTAVDSLTDTLIIPALSIYCYGTVGYFSTDYWNINPIENYVSHENGIACSNCVNLATGWIELPNGWYIIFATVRVTSAVTNGYVSMTCYPTCYTLPFSYLYDGQPNVTGEFYVGSWQLQRGGVHSPIKFSSNADITTVSDTITHTPTAALGANGRTFGISGNPLGLFRDTEAVLETTALDTASKFQVKVQAQADGDLDFSAKDSGASAVTQTDTKADTDIGQFTVLQIELEGSSESQTAEFFKDNTSLGTAAAHSIADADQIEGDDIVIGGFGGVLRAIALDDVSDQADNYAYLSRHFSTIDDSINGSDVASALQTFLASASDSVALADSVTVLASYIVSVVEALQLSEIADGLASYQVTVADAFAIADATNGVVQYSVTVSDAIQVSDTRSVLQTYLGTVSDGLQISESASALAHYLITVVDGLSLSDVVQALGTYDRTATDSLNFADVASAIGSYVRTASDAIQVSDLTSAIRTFIVSVTDALAVADTRSVLKTFVGTANDSIAISDIASVIGSYLGTATDSISVSELITGLVTLFATVNDAVAFGDSVVYPLIGESLVAGFRIRPSLQADSVRIRPSLEVDKIRIRPSLQATVRIR